MLKDEFFVKGCAHPLSCLKAEDLTVHQRYRHHVWAVSPNFAKLLSLLYFSFF
jgi:hypothetical protein